MNVVHLVLFDFFSGAGGPSLPPPPVPFPALADPSRIWTPHRIALRIREDLENPGGWESDTFAFEFKNKAAILAGDTLASSPPPILTSFIVPAVPAGYVLPTMSLFVPPIAASETQVLCNVTLPNGAPPAMFSVSCLAYTTAGKKLVVPGWLIAGGSS